MRTLALLLLAGCASDVDDTKCTDPKYNNGTCDLDLACDAPDIDCFEMFSTQAEAQTWYATTPYAAAKPAVPATDPRYAKMRSLLDEGWAGYKASHVVGELADHDVQLVIVQTSKIDLGAFVTAANPSQAALAVFVETSLIDLNAPDEQVMGVVMHELQHAIGLHVLPAVKAGFDRYYVAPAGSEPFGSDQLDDAVVRQHAEDWLASVEDIGYNDEVELHGWPVDGYLAQAFVKAVAMRLQTVGATCMTSVTAMNNLNAALRTHLGALDGHLALAGTGLDTQIPMVFGAFTTNCFNGVTADAITIVAQMLGANETQLRAKIPADVRAQIEGQTFIQGLSNWIFLERKSMRDIEADFAAKTGQPWSRLRFYSTEEAADDSSVASLRAMGLPADGIGKILPTLRPGLEPICRPLVDGHQPIPYGDDLSDDHHATCWRAGHVEAKAAAGERAKLSNRVQVLPARKRSVLAPAVE